MAPPCHPGPDTQSVNPPGPRRPPLSRLGPVSFAIPGFATRATGTTTMNDGDSHPLIHVPGLSQVAHRSLSQDGTVSMHPTREKGRFRNDPYNDDGESRWPRRQRASSSVARWLAALRRPARRIIRCRASRRRVSTFLRCSSALTRATPQRSRTFRALRRSLLASPVPFEPEPAKFGTYPRRASPPSCGLIPTGRDFCR